MLTKEESWEYYLSLQNDFVRINDTYVNLAMRNKLAVLMSKDKFGRIIGLSQNFKSLKSVQKDGMAFGLLKEPDYNQAVEFFSEDTLQAHGIVPWWIQIMKYKLTVVLLPPLT